MVTTDQIESLGWVHKSTTRNGGSKVFYLNNFSLFSNADNFLTKNLNHITISKFGSVNKLNELFNDDVSTIDELIDLMVKLNIDIQLTRDSKIDQIVND